MTIREAPGLANAVPTPVRAASSEGRPAKDADSGELDAAIARLLERLNTRPLRKLPGSRRSMFEQLDRPALRPLPTRRYVFAQWKKARVNVDCHYCSVPHILTRRQLDVRLTATTVGIAGCCAGRP